MSSILIFVILGGRHPGDRPRRRACVGPRQRPQAAAARGPRAAHGAVRDDHRGAAGRRADRRADRRARRARHHPRASRGHGQPAGPAAAAPGRLPGRRSGAACSRLLSRDRLDEDTWEEIEDTLITADVGVGPTQELVEKLRTRLRVEGADRGQRPRRSSARSCWPWSTRRWTAASRSPVRTASPAWCSSWASTAPARPPRSASSPGCWSPRTRRSCSAPRTPSAPPPPSS